MNRPFKFRVWHKGKNQWVHPPGEEPNIFIIGGFCRAIPTQELGDCIAQQFTGLQDKNGKDIYEGDIISGEFFDTEYHHSQIMKAEVVFNFGAFNISSINWNKASFRIIGNIFENSELCSKN